MCYNGIYTNTFIYYKYHYLVIIILAKYYFVNIVHAIFK